MEWILLLLAGGLAAGVGLWAARPGTPSESEEPRDPKRGPVSSPALPGSDQDRGKAVRLGPDQIKSEIKDLLDQAPRKIRGRGIAARDEAQQHSKTPLKVTYNTDQLIARSSRYAHHRRVLQNAELMVDKQKAADALELFERVHNRVADADVQSRIQTNIDDIRRWLAGFESEEDNLRFPEIVVPLTLQNLALENLSEGIKQLSDSLVTKIVEATRAVNAIPAVSVPPGIAQVAAQAAAQAAAAYAGAQPLPAAGPASPVTAPSVSAPSAAGPAAMPGAAPAAFAPPDAAAYYPQAFPATSDLPPGAILPVIPRFYPPSGEWFSDDYTKRKKPAAAAGPSNLPSGLTLDDNGNLVTDGWTDSDFEREWQKYKNLPPYDRRSGVERRKSQDRRGSLDPRRKDRRSGTDRRQQDLFKERDEFLKKLEEHKKRKQALEDWEKNQKLPELPPVEMPLEPGKVRPDTVIEISNAVVNIGDLSKKPEEPEAEQVPEPEPEPAPAEPEKEEEEEPRHVIFETPPLDLPPVGMPAVDSRVGGELFEAARDLSSQPLASLGLPSGTKIEDAMPVPSIAEGEPAPEAMAGETEAAPADGGLPGLGEEGEAEGEAEEPKKETQIQEIRGVLELKPPEEDDAPFLTLTYDFAKIPDSFKLSRDYHTMEYAYYKYKPMLVKAQEFTRRKMLKNALNYYRVIKSQNIPPEFKRMINRNIKDITEYLEKFLMSRAG